MDQVDRHLYDRSNADCDIAGADNGGFDLTRCFEHLAHYSLNAANHGRTRC
jgi:hypothetical protein